MQTPLGTATVGLGGVEWSQARTPGSPHSKMTRGVRVGAGPERRAGVRPAGQANRPRARVIKLGRLGGPSELLETRRCWLQEGEWRGRGPLPGGWPGCVCLGDTGRDTGGVLRRCHPLVPAPPEVGEVTHHPSTAATGGQTWGLLGADGPTSGMPVVGSQERL